MASTVPLVSEQAPSALSRSIFAIASLLYLGLALAFIPWADEPSRSDPSFVLVWGAGTIGAELCIAALFAAEFRRTRCSPLLIVACASLFGACMALVCAFAVQAVFALDSGPAQQRVADWLFLSWHAGTGVLLFSAVRLALRHDSELLMRSNARLIAYAGGAGAVGASVLITLLVVRFGAGMNPRGSLAGVALLAACIALQGAAVVMIWRRRTFDDALFLWIALTLVAALADLVLSGVTESYFTIGWAIGKSGSVVAAYMLLAFLLTRASSHGRGAAPAARLAAYGGALAIMCAAILIRWCLIPWMGVQFPYETLFGAVAVSVWLGGWQPAMLAALLGYAVASFWLTSMMGPLRVFTPAQALGFGLYSLSCALIVVLGERMRRARDRFREAQERFRSSQEASLQGFSLLRPIRDANQRIVDFRIEYVNPTGARMARSAVPGQLIGRTLSRMLPSVTNSTVFEHLARVAETGVPLDIELEFQGDGIHGWFRNMAVRAGELIAVSYSDITHSKLLEQELKQRAEELQRADTNKSQFLALLSHELRNPLAPIRNGLALLRRKYGAEDTAGVHAMMDRQMRQLTRLIDDLLDLSRIDRGKLDLHREKVSLESIVSSAVETARPNIEIKSQELRVRGPDRPLHVDGDPVRLAQVISNLLNNAAKFTGPGGRIEIRTGAERGVAVIRVRDNGIGLAPEHLNHIFEMFVQLDSEREQATGGLGLGLTLVRSIIALHGGTVEAHSEGPGKGSEFVVRLPLVEAPVESLSAPKPGGVWQRRRILVVDDNADAAASLGALLRLEGHDVATACDGPTALSIGAVFRPDTAFVDLNMPGMDGIELARHLRESPWASDIRLVAVTGMGQRSDIEKTRAAGFHAHLTKPASLEDLLRAASAAPAPTGAMRTPKAARN